MNSDPRLRMDIRELLVVIGIIALFIIQVVPAIRETRVGGWRANCQNNMRQIALGILAFENSEGSYPNAGTYLDDPAVHQGDPRKSSIFQVVSDPHGAGGNPRTHLHSWVVDILPYIDNQELYNAWNFRVDYLDATQSPDLPSNSMIASTVIGILRCPQDPTAVIGKGNLSYVANGGFARWPAMPFSWTGSDVDGAPATGPILHWTPPGADWKESQAVGHKLGVMFLGTHTGDQPWDIKTTPKDLTDGASTTLLVGENTLAGFSDGTSPYSAKRETNWASPLPNFAMFLGSDNICQSGALVNACLDGQLAPTPEGKDGPGWAKSNLDGTFENIGFGSTLSLEGSFPFIAGPHPRGSNFLFCDGSVRYIANTIDGSVYSRILTPAGETLPGEMRQAPLANGADELQ
ncbi:DUF1559 domain-containing protein [Singulisphaera sp. PoT]|uniref:DUF1559 family PulG-like putative transporter n=1 Tax=Singulisphaera sp. PoT TaxID=3411797 RepID=UPI003BF6117C